MVHPNSLANLEKGKATQFDGETAVISGKKGAEVTNRKKAERKTAMECAEIIAGMPVNEKVQARMERAGFKRKDMTHIMAMMFAQYARAIEKGDVNAAKLILSMLGELPKDETALTFENAPQVVLEAFDDGRGGYE